MTAFVDDNEFPKLLFKEGSAPASPAAGDQALWIDSSDHVLKLKNSSAVVSAVGAAYAGARYHQAAATVQSIPNNTYTVVNFDTVDFDTGSAVTTGASWHFTAPVAGKYQVLVMVAFDATITPPNATIYGLRLNKNGTADAKIAVFEWSPAATTIVFTILNGGDVISLAAADTLSVSAFQNSGSAQTLVGDITYNHIAIHQVH